MIWSIKNLDIIRYKLLLFITLLCSLFDLSSTINGCTSSLYQPTSLRRKVICGDPKKRINRIPIDLPKSTFILTINYQNITEIDENDFLTVSELRFLYIKYSRLKSIHHNAFKSLDTLEYLDLTGNFLSFLTNSLPKDCFKYLTKLKVLKLSKNPLGFIPNHVFRPMSSTLTNLIINDCNKPPLMISSRAFEGLYNLNLLDLTNNHIKTLNSATQIDFRNMKLQKLYLFHNKWHCNCKIRWLYNYLMEIQNDVKLYNERFKKFDNSGILKCFTPVHLRKYSFPTKLNTKFSLLFTDFVCNSYCKTSSTKIIRKNYNDNVNLTCSCFADPIQSVLWKHNGRVVTIKPNKHDIYKTGREYFNSTMVIKSFDISDIGNWTCEINLTIKSKDIKSYRFLLDINTNSSYNFNKASVNMYIFVGLGSSLLLISFLIVLFVLFCNRDNLCQYHNPHPMVICGYHESRNYRKPSTTALTNVIDNQNELDNDIRYQYNQNNGRYTGFYENTIPLNRTNLNRYHSSTLNHTKSNNVNNDLTLPLPNNKSNTNNNTTSLDTNSSILKSTQNNDKMLNMYCGCNNYSVFNSDNDDNDENRTMLRTDYATMPTRSFHHQHPPPSSHQLKSAIAKPADSEDNYQTITSHEFEKLFPKIKQCPFHGSSATLTRIPSKKPCPVHSSTATLPSRLNAISSSTVSKHKRSDSISIEHRHNCPKHYHQRRHSKNPDNISVKSLKLDTSNHEINTISRRSSNIHRSKSVGKLMDSPYQLGDMKPELMSSLSYKPCPLHGNLLVALTETGTDKKQPSTPAAIKSKPISNHSKLINNQDTNIDNHMNDSDVDSNSLHLNNDNTTKYNTYLNTKNNPNISVGCDTNNNGSSNNNNSSGYSTMKRSGHLKKSLKTSSKTNLKSVEKPSSPLITADVHGTLV